MVNPDMCVNLSRHTVSFSDFAWPESAPTFPKAWQIGQYLRSYLELYSGVDIQTSCKVLKASRSTGGLLDHTKRWKVEVKKCIVTPAPADSPRSPDIIPQEAQPSTDSKGITSSHSLNSSSHVFETHYFDYLIVASGFFGSPKLPLDISKSTSFPFPVIHSTQFRDVRDLLKGTETTKSAKGSKIVVVGGSMSGAEVAASIAAQLSSDVNSSTPAYIGTASDYTVYHVVQRPFWAFPLFLPVKPLLGQSGDDPKVGS